MNPHRLQSEPAWRPLLAAAEAELALDAVADIARDLRDFVFQDRLAGLHGPPGRGHSLAGGEAGLALFFAYLDRCRPGEGHDELAMELLDRAVAGTDEMGTSGLYSGFPGIAWALEHLQGRLFESEEGEDLGESAAGALLEILGEEAPWTLHYDLISGLGGHGVYAWERLGRPGGVECLARVVARFAELAERKPEGLAWRVPRELTSERFRERFTGESYNLGVAHGVPGVISVLAGSCATLPAARPLLDGAVSWLLSQKLPAGSPSAFPYSVGAGRRPDPTRLAWCYGDPGVAAALLAAARTVGEPAWEREALDIGRAAAARPGGRAGVLDAGLCHGAAGLAHLFNRLHQASADLELAAAARSWYARALAMRRPGQGIGGFLAWNEGENGELGWQDEPGFLVGAAGIGLALLAAATPVEPEWDRLLLASLPPAVP